MLLLAASLSVLVISVLLTSTYYRLKNRFEEDLRNVNDRIDDLVLDVVRRDDQFARALDEKETNIHDRIDAVEAEFYKSQDSAACYGTCQCKS